MGFVSGPELTAAVSEAGGLGQMGTGPMPPPLLREYIGKIRGLTRRPFAINIIVETTAFGPLATVEHVNVLAEGRVPIVVFFWNPPPQAWIDTLRRAGTRVWLTAGNPTDVRTALALVPDALIVQGHEAGGHVRASLGLLPLLRMVKKTAHGIPLIAAGGIGDGQTAAAALAAGADAICVGTRLVATRESEAHDEYKARLVRAEADDTVVTDLFGPEWPNAPMRVVKNRAVERAFSGAKPPPTKTIGQTKIFGQPYAMPLHSAMLATRATTGDFEEMCLAAGVSVGGVTAVTPAQTVVESLMAEAAEALAAASPAQ
jgi:enoyl-[acyl-carrier protein] reductase II